MSIHKRLKGFFPKGFLWRLTFLNIVVIAIAIALSSWAIYNTACFLVEGMGGFDGNKQQRFNATLSQYLWIFSIIGIITASMLHFYFTKKIVHPIRQLIDSTKKLKEGKYPDVVTNVANDEIGELAQQYNGLIQQLQTNEEHRQKLVSDLSHEFRTPLSNLNGYLHALETGVIEPDKRLFHSLYQESKRLTQMLEQLEQLKEWDYVETQAIPNKQTVDISDQLNQCAAMFEWTLQNANIPIEIKTESVEMSIQVNGIQQVISNLLSNAIEYYSGNGPIILQGELLKSFYRVSVSGPSRSIPEVEKDKLFDRFYRLDASRNRDTGGTGLGLAIAREVVERHHGEIGVKTDEKNNRNCFWFTLPSQT